MRILLAIADPSRRRSLRLPAERDRMAGERVERFVMGAPGILQQLKVLRKAGLVSSPVQSQSRIQALNPAVLDKLEVRMKRTHSLWSRRLHALELELNAKDEREAEGKKEKQ